jgi:hypothetical protein
MAAMSVVNQSNWCLAIGEGPYMVLEVLAYFLKTHRLEKVKARHGKYISKL